MIDFYCIHKEGDKESNGPLTDAINSGKQYGINVIPYAGVYSNIDKHLEQNNLFVNPNGAHKVTRRGNGVLGCFFSHFYLWKKSLEDNVAVGVLEYDAIFIKPLPANILDTFTDYLHLDYTRHTHLSAQSSGDEYLKQIELEKSKAFEVRNLTENPKAKNRNLFKYINNNHIRGAFGYIIKPSGAAKIIDATKKYGILPADVQPNLAYCDIQHSTPSTVMLNPKGLKNRFGGSHTNHDRTI
jgi:GR25 family glycosyltransferase involved in LPS biosynthesis